MSLSVEAIVASPYSISVSVRETQTVRALMKRIEKLFLRQFCLHVKILALQDRNHNVS